MSDTETKNYNANAAEVKVGFAVIAGTNGQISYDAARFEDANLFENHQYDSKGNYEVSSTDEAGNQTKYYLDGVDPVANPSGVKRGNLTRVVYPSGDYAEYQYDLLDRLISTWDASGLKTNLTYDSTGNVTQTDYINNTTNALIGSTKQTFNEFGEVLKDTDQNGKETTFSRDENGNVIKISKPNGNEIDNEYDPYDEVSMVTYKNDLTTWDLQYDQNGNVTQIKKNGTDTTTQTIDPKIDQVNKITYPSISGFANSTDFGYNPSGKLTSVTHNLDNGLKLISLFGYYSSGDLASTTGYNGETQNILYDEEGKVKKQITTVGGYTYNSYYEYNDQGLFTKLKKENPNGTIIATYTYYYDVNNNVYEIDLSDGSKLNFKYDSTERLVDEKETNSAGSIVTETSYTYDAMGNRLTSTKNGVTTQYIYDAANQLTSVNGQNYTYDDNGNEISNGNNTYEYDSEDQLTKVKDHNGNTIAQYEYDFDGNRTKKIAGNKTENYYYVGKNLSYITDENNKLKMAFTKNSAGGSYH